MPDEDDEDLDSKPGDDDAPDEDVELPDRGAGGRGASDAIAHLPGFSKLLDDQRDVLLHLLDGFRDRDELYAWVLTLHAHGLGRRPELGRVVVNERVVPFLLVDEWGAERFAVTLREDLAVYLIDEFFAPAQAQFSKKAREEIDREVRYIRDATQKDSWEAWDRGRDK